jgi:Fe-S oxidoreductase
VSIEAFVAARLRDNPQALRFRPDAPALLYHGHCHQKSLTGTADAVAVLEACTRGRASEINSGCCGMAGAFGHEVEHYDVAHAVGEQRLFPAVRARGDAEIAISGFSCRHHIEHHTSVPARHLIEFVAEALA